MCIMQLSNGLFTREQLFGESSQVHVGPTFGWSPRLGKSKTQWQVYPWASFYDSFSQFAAQSRSDSAFSAWPIDKANTMHHIAAKYGPCAAWLLYYLSARVAGKAGRVWAAHGKRQIFGDINWLLWAFRGISDLWLSSNPATFGVA